jgi:hypothetical protein
MRNLVRFSKNQNSERARRIAALDLAPHLAERDYRARANIAGEEWPPKGLVMACVLEEQAPCGTPVTTKVEGGIRFQLTEPLARGVTCLTIS